jgi:hypothetical protein
VPYTFQDLQAVGVVNGLIFATSNLKDIVMSPDYTNSWIDTRTYPFTWGTWPALYQSGPDEIAMVMTSAGNQGLQGEYIQFGTINASALETVPAASTCRNPTQRRPQICY